MDQITKKPVVDGGLDNIGAEGGNRQNECSTMLLSAVMPFMLVFSPLVHIAVSG